MHTLNKEIAGTFDPLYEILARYKIDAPIKYYSISHRNRAALSARTALFFAHNLRAILDLVNRSQGIVFSFDKYNPKWGQTEKIARKAAFYSDISVIILSGRVQLLSAQDREVMIKSRAKKIRPSTSATNLGNMVETLLMIRPLIERGIVIPLPGDMEIGLDPEIMDPSLPYDYNTTIEMIRRCQLESTLIPVSLDRWQIKAQIEEITTVNSNTRNLKPLYIYLPHLSRLDLGTLITLREDNYDAFFRFQQALRDFLVSASISNSESKFIEIARKVDFEINELELKVKQLAQERKRKGWQIAFGVAASAVSFLVDAQLASYVTAILGSKSAFEGVSFLSNRSKFKDIIESHRYYMAYLAKRAAENRQQA
jgi:hypothetical protein